MDQQILNTGMGKIKLGKVKECQLKREKIPNLFSFKY